MSENQEEPLVVTAGNGNPGTPKPDNTGAGNNNNLTKSEAEVLSIKLTGKEIATKAIRIVHNYDKLLLKDIKANLLERDAELVVLAGDYIEQEARIGRLRRTIMRMNREMAAAKQDSKNSADMSRKLTETLVQVISQPESKAEPNSEGEKSQINEDDTDATSDHEGPDPKADEGSEPKIDEPDTSDNIKKYFLSDPYYQECIKGVNLDELDMVHEADEMIKPADIDFDEEEIPFKYRVPPYLMGLITGRQKQTIRRIINQTSTEIEPISWSEEGRRQMGFKILGSHEAITTAIDLMVDVVRTMDVTRAQRIIKGHYRPEKAEPKPTPKAATSKSTPKATTSKSTPKATTSKPNPKAATGKGKSGNKGGSKSTSGKSSESVVCIHFRRGYCRNGSRCHDKHVSGKDNK